MFKTCLETFGNDFGHFGILKRKILKIFENSTFHGTLGKKKFRKICPKTRSKHVWILSGTILGIFGILKKKIFENFRKLDPPWNTGHKFFSKKITLKHVWILLGTLLGFFGILKLFFFESFRRLDIPWKTGQKFFEKFAPKHVQNMFGDFWERFWAFWNFEKKNFENFRKLDLPWSTGHKIFSKKSP